MTVKKIPIRKPFKAIEFFLRWEWMLVGLIVIACIINSSTSPYFLRVNNLFNMTFNFLERGLMTFPMAFVIITAGIDLSVASNLAMSSNVMGQLFAHGVNIWVAAAIALGIGSLGGLINGLLITRIKLPPLAATLGTYTLYRGIAYVLTKDGSVTNFPKDFTFLGQGYVFGTPIPFEFVLYGLLLIPFALVLHRTTFGRYTFAIGNSPEASRFAGVRTNRMLLTIYTVSGFMAALAGVLMASRFGSVRADIATGAELDVITAVVLGGVDIFGGSGTMPGVVLALFLLGIVRYGMNLVNIPPQIQIIATGFLLIAAIILPQVLRKATAERIVVEGQERKRRSWLPFALAGAVLVIVILGLLLPGRATAPGADGSPVARTGPTATTVMLLPTNTPPPAPPTPTPRPTHTPAPTTTAAPTVAGEEGATPTPSPTPNPRPDVEMVEVPAGTFTMGIDGTDPKEAPAHEVDLPAFYVDRFETTNNEFARFVTSTGYVTDAEKVNAKKTWRTYYDPTKENHPVVKVSFNDAQSYCQWMGKRLPAEEEWEKAARGADQRSFPYGKLFDTTKSNVRLSNLRGTVAVGSYAGGASPYGVEDMAGNVAEWTSSPFMAYPGSTYQDPQYTEKARITRGGGWFDDEALVRTTGRNAAFPDSGNDSLGFRCVSDTPQQ